MAQSDAAPVVSEHHSDVHTHETDERVSSEKEKTENRRRARGTRFENVSVRRETRPPTRYDARYTHGRRDEIRARSPGTFYPTTDVVANTTTKNKTTEPK